MLSDGLSDRHAPVITVLSIMASGVMKQSLPIAMACTFVLYSFSKCYTEASLRMQGHPIFEDRDEIQPPPPPDVDDLEQLSRFRARLAGESAT
jgi:hypothetical protein